MKRSCSHVAVMVASLMVLFAVNTMAQFRMPTEAQILAVAEDPNKIGDLIADANEDQAVEIILDVVAEIESMDIPLQVMRSRVAVLLAETVRVKGAAGPQIVARVVKKVNPRLLPTITKGGTAPPSSPPYPRQDK